MVVLLLIMLTLVGVGIFEFDEEPSITGAVKEPTSLADKTNLLQNSHKDVVAIKRDPELECVVECPNLRDSSPENLQPSGVLSGSPCGASTPIQGIQNPRSPMRNLRILSEAIELLKIERGPEKEAEEGPRRRKHSGLFVIESNSSVTRSFTEFEEEMDLDEEDDLTSWNTICLDL